ncbi:MAG: TonB-dependent receptor [Acidobacteria bacterium]|nr:TonB-dependent receptor [Acidobacteriota bacterium]
MDSQKIVWKVFLYMVCLAGVALAQVTTGTILGTASDSTGAVIPGARVTARNVQTGIARTVTTDAQGRYRAPELGLGMYEVTAEAAGFQTLVRSGIELTVGRQATVNFAMQVGAVAEVITVTGEAPLLETTNSTVADLVTETQMRQLPLNGRSFTDLAAIQPGVIADIGAPQSAFKGGGRMVMNGARPQQSLYMLDGVEITDAINNTPPVSVMGQTLGVDTILEFTVLQNNYGSQYGRAIGGVVNAVTRSGTNELHGSAFEFLRNEKLDAKNFFDVPEDPIPPFKRNQFGGTLGGPIVKDNAFFFGSYEGLRESLGTTDFSSTMTDEARVGIITNCPINPATGARFRTCTKEEAIVTEVLPKGIHPDILPFLTLIPRGTHRYQNDGSQEFRVSRARVGRENYFMGRIDQRLSDNDRIFGRVVYDYSSRELPDSQFLSDGKTHPTNAEWGAYNFSTLDWTRIVSPTVLNTARFGFSRNRSQQCQCIDGDPRTDVIDFPGIPPQLEVVPGVPWSGPWSVPGVSVPGGTNGIGNSILGAYLIAPVKFVSNTFTYYDSVRISKGRHSLDIGVDIRRFQENALSAIWANGNASWFTPLKNFLTAGQRTTGYCTGGTNDCRGINSLLVTHTLTADNGFAPSDPYRGYRQSLASWYVQDDIQLLSNLTLNFGVRWEHATPPVEVNQKTANIIDVLRDTEYTQLGDKPLFELRDILGGFMPRFGFAYSPDSKTSIRGGFGMFKEMPLFYQFALTQFHPPSANRIQLRNLTQWPNPLAGVDPTTGTRAPIIITYDHKYPYAMQWNFGIERQFGQNWVGRMSYIGTRGINLPAVNNDVQPALSKDANGVLFTPRNQPSVNPAWDNTRTSANIGDAWYNALQMRIQKRFAQGIEFSSSYTWSKNLSQAAGMAIQGGEGGGAFQTSNAWDYKNFDKSRADQDVPHNFNFNFTYEIPVGQGLTFGSNMGNVANTILGGWQVNGTFTKRSGLPRTIGGPGYSTNTFCRCAVRPNLKPGGNTNPVIGELDHWFDETQFLPVAAGYFGNLAKNTLDGPGLTKFDLSVFKGFAIGERKNLQFRAEFFNFANHPVFAGPETSVFETNGRPVDNPGRITRTVGTSRQIQLALKFEF